MAPSLSHSPADPAMAERRYDEEQIRKTLTRATELAPDAELSPGTDLLSPGSAPPAPRGLTLSELEEVAGEVGITRSRIPEAVAEIELSRSLAPATKPHLGVTLTAAHAVQLLRMLTEEEWDRFVVRLRDTFGATGAVRTEGSLQTWSKGYLKVLLEPLSTGARLRVQSMDGASKQWVDSGLALGVSGAVAAVALGVLSIVGGKPLPWLFWGLVGAFAAGGRAMWSDGRAKAAKWLPTRERQFRLLGEEVRRIADTVAAPRLEGPSSPTDLAVAS